MVLRLALLYLEEALPGPNISIMSTSSTQVPILLRFYPCSTLPCQSIRKTTFFYLLICFIWDCIPLLSIIIDTMKWRKPIIKGGPQPAPRGGHCSFVVKHMPDKMILFGGFDGKTHYNDLWILDTGT